MNAQTMVVALAVVICLYATGSKAWGWVKALLHAYGERTSALEQLAKELGNLRDTASRLEKTTDTMEKIPEYLGGLVKVCEAQVEQYDQFSQTVKEFRDSIVKPPDRDEVKAYDEDEADLTFRKQGYLAEGWSDSEAEIKAKIDQDKTILTPGV
jgi:Asp-tRNA(Asn)/Glu-tRNA(Gln) amidotransferase C subunit